MSVAVVGGGITGVTAALELRRTGSAPPDVTLFEAAPSLGGKIGGGPFAGLRHVDSGADAFLARVPDAVDHARTVGLGEHLVAPEPVGAAVWHDELWDIPDGLVLGLPSRLAPLATTGLLSWKGKVRAAIEPLLPRTSIDEDSVGAFVRARFGDEVHERLVDALVGSIYAADTDRFSLAEVPQLAALAREHRSVLLGARRTAAANRGTGSAAGAPIFNAPRDGMSDLVHATAAAFEAAGGTIRRATTVDQLEPTTAPGRRGWRVGGSEFDAVVLACPPAATARLLGEVSAPTAELLGTAETADVAMLTLHVAADEWPSRLSGRSGYLVPKPDQRSVTAVSFASQKWAHWRPPAGGEVLRVSLGRDGMPVLHLDDDELVHRTVDDLEHHLGLRIAPVERRISRWPAAFAQYRPGHASWVDAVEASLPDGVFVAGAGYRGIGIPACIRQARTIAERCARRLGALQDS